MSYELHCKGQGRIFVFKQKDVKVVKDTLKEINEFEAGYCPEDFITVYKDEKSLSDLVYIGKFDPNLIELIKRCGEKGVGILIRSKANIDENYIY